MHYIINGNKFNMISILEKMDNLNDRLKLNIKDFNDKIPFNLIGNINYYVKYLNQLKNNSIINWAVFKLLLLCYWRK